MQYAEMAPDQHEAATQLVILWLDHAYTISHEDRHTWL